MINDKIIVYRSFYNPIEASIIKSKLDDYEIPCFLTDENIATINPLYNQAIDGVRLHIFERHLAQINEILIEDTIIEIETESSNSGLVCPNCGSTNVAYVQATQERFDLWVTIISLLLFIYPFKANKSHHCFNCEHEFN